GYSYKIAACGIASRREKREDRMRGLTIGALALCASMLAACGGGGGGGNKTPAQTPPQATLSLPAQSITASASYWDSAPTSMMAVTLANPPAEGIYVDYS